MDYKLVILNKDGLRTAASIKGCSNKKIEYVNEKSFQPGTLRFDGFVGERLEDGMWHGHYRFSTTQADECPRASFAKLFNKTSEVTDGIQSHDNAASE